MLLNHPQTVPHSQSMEKLSSPKVIPGVRKFGDHCDHCTSKNFISVAGSLIFVEFFSYFLANMLLTRASSLLLAP